MIGAYKKKQQAFKGWTINPTNFPNGFLIKGIDFMVDCFFFFREP